MWGSRNNKLRLREQQKKISEEKGQRKFKCLYALMNLHERNGLNEGRESS